MKRFVGKMSKVQSLKLCGKQGGYSWHLESELFGDLNLVMREKEAPGGEVEGVRSRRRK
jgi:hypothetical protein